MYAIEHNWENLNLLVEDISLYAQIPSRTRTRMGREGETSMMASNSNYEWVPGKGWSLKANGLKLWSADTSNDSNHRPQEFMIDQASRSDIPSQNILLEGAAKYSGCRKQHTNRCPSTNTATVRLIGGALTRAIRLRNQTEISSPKKVLSNQYQY